ncbi:DUF6879 family protein [Streptomyces cyaneofuscatus]|uniref:DUF6879 family protein n=1 Tax=Streptomyces cyaneofuscatus TaxID=66883 RepID=UPI003794847A
MAGEELHILDVTDLENPLAGVPDFWLCEGREPVVLNYDDNGGFTGPTLFAASREFLIREESPCAAYRSTALALPVPFAE